MMNLLHTQWSFRGEFDDRHYTLSGRPRQELTEIFERIGYNLDALRAAGLTIEEDPFFWLAGHFQDHLKTLLEAGELTPLHFAVPLETEGRNKERIALSKLVEIDCPEAVIQDAIAFLQLGRNEALLLLIQWYAQRVVDEGNALFLQLFGDRVRSLAAWVRVSGALLDWSGEAARVPLKVLLDIYKNRKEEGTPT